MDDKLTTKQRLFVEAYLANPNATEAARRAGYAGNDATLRAVASENLSKPNIAALISERVETAVITANEILSDVKDIAKTSERDADRLKAYEMLGKHLKLWTDKVETTGKDGGPIETTNTVKIELIDD